MRCSAINFILLCVNKMIELLFVLGAIFTVLHLAKLIRTYKREEHFSWEWVLVIAVLLYGYVPIVAYMSLGPTHEFFINLPVDFGNESKVVDTFFCYVATSCVLLIYSFLFGYRKVARSLLHKNYVG